MLPGARPWTSPRSLWPTLVHPVSGQQGPSTAIFFFADLAETAPDSSRAAFSDWIRWTTRRREIKRGSETGAIRRLESPVCGLTTMGD